MSGLKAIVEEKRRGLLNRNDANDEESMEYKDETMAEKAGEGDQESENTYQATQQGGRVIKEDTQEQTRE